jgi:hypothetical protein
MVITNSVFGFNGRDKECRILVGEIPYEYPLGRLRRRWNLRKWVLESKVDGISRDP